MKKGFKAIVSTILVLSCILMNVIPVKATLKSGEGGITYYLDSNANDNGDGSSEISAWNSLDQVNNHLFQPGDKLLIKRGSIFYGTLYPKGSGANGSPIIIDVYGHGEDKPLIDAGGKTFIPQQKNWQGPFVNLKDESTIGSAIYLYNQEYWEINNISVTNSREDNLDSDRSGIRIEGYDYGVINHIYIRGCEVKDVKGFNGQDDIYPVVPTKSDGTPMFPDLTDPGENPNNSKLFSGARTTHRTGGINLATYTARLSEAKNDKGVVEQAIDKTKKVTTFNDILIENNTISNCTANGITTTNVKGTLDDDAFRHTNVVIRNNSIDHVSRSGIIPLYTSGVLVERNLIDNFQSTIAGYGCGIWADRANDMVFQYNEVKNGQNYNDGMAFNLDDMTRNGIIQYNYTHDNVGGGYMLHVRPKSYNRNHVIRYNVSINDGGSFRNHVAQIVAVGEDKDPTTQIENANVYNNTFISNKDVHPVFKGNEVKYKNNIWYFTNPNLANRVSPFDFGPNSTFDNNVYYGVNEPNRDGVTVDNNAKLVDPLFMNKNVFGLPKEELLQAIKLQSKSSLIEAATPIENDGGLDFFGYDTDKERINIGAYNGKGHEATKQSYTINSTDNEVKKYLSDATIQNEVIHETASESNTKWVNTTFEQEPLVYTKSNGAYVEYEFNGNGIIPTLKTGPGAGDVLIEVFNKEDINTVLKSKTINTYSETPEVLVIEDFNELSSDNNTYIIRVKNINNTSKAVNVIKFNVKVNEEINCNVDSLENVFIEDGNYVISYYEDSINIPLKSYYVIDSCKDISDIVDVNYNIVSGVGIISNNILSVSTSGEVVVEVTAIYKNQIKKAQATYNVIKAEKPPVNEWPKLPGAGIYEAEDQLVVKEGSFVTLNAETALNGNQLKTSTKNDNLSLEFYGNEVSIYGRKAVGTCIVKVDLYKLVDGEEVPEESVNIDCYKNTMEDQALIYNKSFEENGSYKVKITNTGTKNPNANDAYNMIIDYFVVDEIIDEEVEEVNKTALKITIDYAEELILEGALEDVVPAVVNEFNKALEEAKEVYANEKATEVEVDASFKRLTNVIWMLEFKKGDKKSLQVLVDSAKALVEKEYTSDSWANLQKEIIVAEAVIADENAMQDEVDKALNSLKEAIDSLVKNNVDKSQLESFINKVEGLNKAEYIESTWNKFEKALEVAKNVLADENATQENVYTAYNNLVRAYMELRLIPDKSKLEDLINKIEKMDLSKYTKESVKTLNKELNKANKVLKDKNATQQEIDSVTKSLSLAVDKLEVKEVANSGNLNENNSVNNNTNKNSGKGGNLPNAGAVVSSAIIVILGAVAVISGLVILKRRNRKSE